MKVSIITVCYNRKSTIEKSIQSVLNQGHEDIEYIVIDGNSNDGTRHVIEKYKTQITHYISEPDKGMYDAINKGIILATGDIIGLMHSDDEFFDNGVVSLIVNTFSTNPLIEAIYGDGVYVSNDKEEKIVRNRIGGDYSIGKIKKGWLPLHPTVYIKRSVIMKYGGYSMDYEIASDTEFLLRYLYKNNIRIKYIESYIVKMRVGGLSTSKLRAFQVLREDYLIYKFHGFFALRTVIQKKLFALTEYLKSKELIKL